VKVGAGDTAVQGDMLLPANAALTERGAEVVEKTTGVSPRPVEGRS